MDQVWSADYRVGDCIYSIVEKTDLHTKLSADEEFLRSYVTQSTANTELRMIDAEAQNKEDEAEAVALFKWEANPTQLFIRLYKERYELFRDKKTRKKTLWTEISRNMFQSGYNVDEDTLDRKMRNMKKTFRTIKINMKKSGGKRVRWEHYDTFEEMFGDDLAISSDPLSAASTASNYESGAESCFTSPASSPEPRRKAVAKKDKREQTKATSEERKVHSLEYIRAKMLKVEEIKAAASVDLNRILKKTNQIMQERNDLLRRFLDSR